MESARLRWLPRSELDETVYLRQSLGFDLRIETHFAVSMVLYYRSFPAETMGYKLVNDSRPARSHRFHQASTGEAPMVKLISSNFNEYQKTYMCKCSWTI